MKPTIGRIVIFYDLGRYDGPVPAIVTQVHGDGDVIDLTAFPANLAPVPHSSVKFADGTVGRQWSWPPRV